MVVLQKILGPILAFTHGKQLDFLEELTLLIIQFVLLSFSVAVFIQITF
ncbi:MAG: hypothetical protein ABEI32_05110 [Halothece sp.]|jgi:hypothetical protein